MLCRASLTCSSATAMLSRAARTVSQPFVTSRATRCATSSFSATEASSCAFASATRPRVSPPSNRATEAVTPRAQARSIGGNVSSLTPHSPLPTTRGRRPVRAARTEASADASRARDRRRSGRRSSAVAMASDRSGGTAVAPSEPAISRGAPGSMPIALRSPASAVPSTVWASMTDSFPDAAVTSPLITSARATVPAS